jgi:hypothetical protein
MSAMAAEASGGRGRRTLAKRLARKAAADSTRFSCAEVS